MEIQRKSNMKHILFLLLCFTTVVAKAQPANISKPYKLDLDAFIGQLKQHHPVAKQAGILVEKAEAELLATRGAFMDPSVTFNTSRKTFDGKSYFIYNRPEIKLPTLFGADFKAGLENNGGPRLSSEESIGRTSYLGVEMPVLRNLLFDKRRAALQQARLFRTQSEQERLIVLNNLLLDAYVAYWQWAGTYQLYQNYTRFLEVSNERFKLVKIAYANGDRAEIDTIEALTQVQSFTILQQEARMKLVGTSLDVSNFLWMEKDSSYLLPETAIPDTLLFTNLLQLEPVENFIMRSNAQNPMLRTYDFKLQALEVERKLKFQSLLPYVNLKYNLLNQGYYVFKDVNTAFLENNYKWGLDVKIPLFFREGRGDYRAAKLKITETRLELNNKRWETENKIRYYHNEFSQLYNQIITATQAYNNYTKLLKAEELRFRNGESTLFVLNARENKVLETTQKLIELRIKYFKAQYTVQWASGALR